MYMGGWNSSFSCEFRENGREWVGICKGWGDRRALVQLQTHFLILVSVILILNKYLTF